MATHPPREGDLSMEVDAERRWSVHRCAHGCFHITLDRLTLTMTEDELHALHALLNQASQRFSGEVPAPVRTRTH